MIRVEHLDLVQPHDQDAAVAAALAGAFDLRRRGPLDVKLDVAELVARHQRAGARADFEVAVLDRPFRVHGFAGVGAAAGLRPFREVLAVEQHDGVGRRRSRRRAGRHDRRIRTRRVVHVPLLAGQHRGVREPEVGARARLRAQRGGGEAEARNSEVSLLPIL